MVNLVLGVITKRLTELERHETLDGMQLAQGQRLFLISFVNTGVLTLIVNSNFFKTTVFNGASHDDFTPAWYAQVGTSMLLTMVSHSRLDAAGHATARPSACRAAGPGTRHFRLATCMHAALQHVYAARRPDLPVDCVVLLSLSGRRRHPHPARPQ